MSEEAPIETEDPQDLTEELEADEVPSLQLDGAITLVILLGSLGLLAHSLRVDTVMLGNSADPGPRFWPHLILGVIAVSAVLNLGIIYKRYGQESVLLVPTKSVITEGFNRRFRDLSTEEWEFYGIIVATAVYLIFLSRVGYLLTTPLYLFAFGWILKYRRPLVLAATSVVVSTGIFVAFRIYMNIALPYGDGIFRSFHLAVEALF
jgi:hypothetical protein